MSEFHFVGFFVIIFFSLSSFQLKFSHGNMAYVMIMLFINIELSMIDNYLSKGFPGQLHEALCKCIGMILA